MMPTVRWFCVCSVLGALAACKSGVPPQSSFLFASPGVYTDGSAPSDVDAQATVDVPDAQGDAPDVENDTSDVENDAPDVENDASDVENDVPDVQNDAPDAENDVPDLQNDGVDAQDDALDLQNDGSDDSGADVASDLCAGVVCDDGNPCTADGCMPATGCTAAPLPDALTCSDGDACTQGETCQGGTCKGGVAISCEDGNACTGDGCDLAAGCTHTDSAAACDDANLCTEADVCAEGACKAGAEVTCDDQNSCTSDACNALTGCQNVANALACDDGDACSTGDVCSGGVCAGAGSAVCDDANPCTSDGCDKSGGCQHTAVGDGAVCVAASCAGGSWQPASECKAGVCGAAPATVACDDGSVCTSDVCNALQGCLHTGQSGSCDDGSLCTAGDNCADGVCKAGVQVACDDGKVCTTDTCATLTGCVHLNNAEPCDDGDACTGSDACGGGTCGGAAVSCDDSNPCTDDSCVAASGCVHLPNAVTCNDGNACTQSDTCQNSACVGANPVLCSASDPCHGVGTCNPASGMCSNPAKIDGTACSDGNLCTQTDSCQAGTCTGASPVVCAAQDACHLAGACEASTGLCSNPEKPNGTSCSDGNACTLADTCQSGVCSGASAVVCTASDSCHKVGACSPATGVCSNPVKADGVGCNDDDPCTQTDLCQAGECIGGNVVTCVAQDQCHSVGACDSATGACSNPQKTNGFACNDGDACTQTDTCQAGACTGANPVLCAAPDQCHTQGTCSGGACNNPAKANSSACDDGDACTQADTCQAGACVGGSPLACSALDQCHAIGTCSGGVCSNPAKADGAPCSDGNACTATDTCQSGACAGSGGLDCDDSNACTTDSCVAPGGCQHVGLGDGLACGGGAYCQASVCTPCPAGTVSIAVNDGGAAKIVCAFDYPVWGARGLTPATLVANGDGTVSDSQTGLDWQAVESSSTSTWAAATSYCDGLSLGQKTDWRLPTVAELESLVDYKSDAILNPNVFTGYSTNYHWTAVPRDAPDQWMVAFNNGMLGWASQASLFAVHCVRGGKPLSAAPTERFTLAGVGVLLDNATGLTWQQGDDGQTVYTAAAARAHCQALSLGGGGWRLPNVRELLSIVTRNGVSAWIDTAFSVAAGTYWSGTSYSPEVNGANWVVRFDAGYSLGSPTSWGYFARCVRGPEACANAAGCDDQDPCTTDACDAGSCTHSFNTASCDDGDKCTQADICVKGVCAGSSVVCSASDACHSAGTCDTGSGVCSNPAKTDGVSCSDGNACTAPDTCQAGACAGGGALDCDDSNTCTTDSCVALGGCQHVALGDGLACGGGAYCQASVCTACPPGTVSIAVNDGGAAKIVCAFDYPVWGARALTPDTLTANGDGTVSDSQTALDWQAVESSNNYTWAAATSYCDGLSLGQKTDWRLPTVAELESLSDYTKSGVLDAAVFTGYSTSYHWTAVARDTPNIWIIRFDNGMLGWTSQANAYPVHCVRGGKPASAAPAARFTLAGVGVLLDNATGLRWEQGEDGNTFIPSEARAHCKGVTAGGTGWRLPNIREVFSLVDRKNAWIDTAFGVGPGGYWSGTPFFGDATSALWYVRFDAGSTHPGAPASLYFARCVRGPEACANAAGCDDQNPCTTDTCDAGACQHANNTASCDDGDACTASDTCSGGVCVGSAPIVCTASDQCHVAGTCNAASGACSNPAKVDGAACNDGSPCTDADTCQSGLCQGGPASKCDDGNVCTADSCDAGAGGCVHASVADGTACEGGKYCVSGTCTAVSVPAGMAVIPAGDYQMGCVGGDVNCLGDEHPPHLATLSAFAIDQYEVTATKYKACVDAGVCTVHPYNSNCTYGVTNKEQHPMTCIDWSQADTYCAWSGGRLPTEAEWEAAARGGVQGQIYPWGNSPDTDCSHAVFDDLTATTGLGCDGGGTKPVGSKPAGKNGYGLYDMAGNVAEWTGDWVDVYPWVAPPNPTGPATGTSKIVRGGAFYNGPGTAYLRASRRVFGESTTADSGIGVRCAMPILNWNPCASRPDGTPCASGKYCSAGSCIAVTVPADMTVIPAGTFWMGCNNAKDVNCNPDELPQHKVTLSAYMVDRTEATVGQWSTCTVESSYCSTPGGGGAATWPSQTNNPVNYVTWAQARSYCQWKGGDLPTEAQWEMAARGDCVRNGRSAADASCATAMRTYPWGEAVADCSRAVMPDATASGCGTGLTWAVGSKPAGDSPYGLHDMAGNVFEWVRDWYSTSYPSADASNPTGAVSGTARADRGGSFQHGATLQRGSFRSSSDPTGSYFSLGLRCTKSFP